MAEKEYIEREAAKQKLAPAINDPEAVDFWEWQCSEIDGIPAADVREVVLCKDCKNYIERSGACAYLVVGMREDDFCSFGEKREETDG